ncbi:hypothetical protein D3C73_948180 [compost metagenome]
MAGNGLFFNTRYTSSGNRDPDAKVYNASNVHNIYIANPCRYNIGSNSTRIWGSIGGTCYSSSGISDQFASDAKCDFYNFSTQ